MPAKPPAKPTKESPRWDKLREACADIRSETGKTLVDVARDVGRDYQIVYNWLTNRAAPNGEGALTILAWCYEHSRRPADFIKQTISNP